MKQHKNSGGSLGFNGQDNSDQPGGYSSKYQHNASGKTASENYGRGPTKVGSGSTGAGPKNPPATAKGGKINGGATVECCKVNVPQGPRKGTSQ